MTNENDSNAPTADPQGQPPPQPPMTPSAPLQGALSDDRKRNAEDTKNEADELAREFRAAEKWVIGTNITLAIIGIFALCIYHGQLEVMRGQLGEIIKQFPEIQKSANAAKSAANTADSTLKSSQEQFRIDERPFMNPKPRGAFYDPKDQRDMTQKAFALFLPDASGKSGLLDIVVDIHNTGRSPSIEVITTSTKYLLGPKDKIREQAKHYIPKYDAASPGIVFAGDAVSPVSGRRPITESELMALTDGTYELYIVGGVQYRDIFLPQLQTPYETTYCYQVLLTGMPFASCGWKSPFFSSSIK